MDGRSNRRPGRAIGKARREWARGILAEYVKSAPLGLIPRDVVLSIYEMLGEKGKELRNELERSR